MSNIERLIYEQECEDFANHSSPWQEHCEDTENAAASYHSELWAAEAASMANEGDYDDNYSIMMTDDSELTDEGLEIKRRLLAEEKQSTSTLNIRDLI